MKTVIIGAGLTGLSCAYHIKDDYIIFEKEKNPGGLCRSVEINGFTFDYTGHFLHLHTEYGKNFIMELMKDNVAEITRNSWIYSHNTYTRYPFQANLYGLPDSVIRECLLGCIETYYGVSGKTTKKNLSFYDWVIKIFGHGFAKHFFFPYNSKVFMTPLKGLTADWIAPYVPQPKLEEVIRGAVTDQKTLFGYNANFYYPLHGGIGALIDILAKKVKHLNTLSPVDTIDWKKKYITVEKQKVPYKNLVSTMPLPELLDRIADLPEKLRRMRNLLKWNSVYCINMGIKREKISDVHWVYFPEKKYIFYRVGFYSNISKGSVPEGCSSTYIEIAYKKGEIVKPKTITKNVVADLNRCGILDKNDRILAVNFLPMSYAYVIYDRNRQHILKTIQDFLGENNIYSIGRFGAWKYSYMEESVLDGKSIAEKIRG